METMYDQPGLKPPAYTPPKTPEILDYSGMTTQDSGMTTQDKGNIWGSAGAGIAIAMGQPWAAPLILLAGNIIGALAARPVKTPLTPEQLWFQELTQFYGDLGKKANAARKIGAIFKVPNANKIGFANTSEAFDSIGIPSHLQKNRPAPTLYDEKGAA